MNAKLEQEVKFLVDDLGMVENRLKDLNAKLIQPRMLERNLRFDTPDRRLSSSFQVLRLRQDSRCRLTFKGASDPWQEVSAREEIEVEVSDLEAARGILEALGFILIVVYEKYRTAYLLGDVEVSLDEMPFGNFIEVEGPDAGNIQKVSENLEMNWKKRSKFSYLMIFNGLKSRLNLTMRDLTFEAFAGMEIRASDLEGVMIH